MRLVFEPVRVDSRPWDVLWEDKGWLEALKALRTGPFVDVVMHTLGELRDRADKANTVEELRGIQAGIEAVKRLVTYPRQAHDVLTVLRAGLEESEVGGDFG